jgi:hypothetical protein
MRFRLIAASVAAFLLCLSGAARAQTPVAGPTPNPLGQQGTADRASTPAVLPTPIHTFADVAGWWWGEVDHYTKVSLQVAPDGRIKLRGPASVDQQAVINLQRLEILSAGNDLYCNLVNGFLTCHARFGRMYAMLNLRKAQQ